jgi:hypothetical protein
METGELPRVFHAIVFVIMVILLIGTLLVWGKNVGFWVGISIGLVLPIMIEAGRKAWK